MDIANAQRLMSPRLWVRRMPEYEAVSTHIAVTAEASQKAREAVPHQVNIRYGPGPKQLLDIYGSDLPKDAPLAVYIHGGYWYCLNKDDCAYCVQPLYAKGCRVIVPGYDLCPTVTVNDIVNEVSEAAKYILKYAADNGVKRLVFMGHSAGGHLVVTLAIRGILTDAIREAKLMDNPPVITIIPFGGVFDLRLLPYTELNKQIRLTEEQAEKLSPLLQPDPSSGLLDNINNIHFIIATCEHDTPELRRQSIAMCEKVKGWGSRARVASMDDIDHFNLVENLSQEDYEMTKIIQRALTENEI